MKVKKKFVFSSSGMKNLSQMMSRLSAITLDKMQQEVIDKLSDFALKELSINADALVYGEGKNACKNNKLEKYTTGFRIYNDDLKAVFAEYGTGIVGSNSPHPEVDDWQYDVNSHGVKGWWFPTDDPMYIKKIGVNGKGYGHTQGESSQPFYYTTQMNLLKNTQDIVMEIIRKELETL